MPIFARKIMYLSPCYVIPIKAALWVKFRNFRADFSVEVICFQIADMEAL